MSEEVVLSEKEKGLLEFLAVEGKPVSIKVIQDKFDDNIVGTLGKLKQLDLIEIVKNNRLEKHLRKQVILKRTGE